LVLGVGGCVGGEVSSYIKEYTDVLLEWVDIFQIYGWDRDFPFQYNNRWGFLNYGISIGHTSANPCTFFITKTNSSIIMK
jgi:hypothetical protein